MMQNRKVFFLLFLLPQVTPAVESLSTRIAKRFDPEISHIDRRVEEINDHLKLLADPKPTFQLHGQYGVYGPDHISRFELTRNFRIDIRLAHPGPLDSILVVPAFYAREPGTQNAYSFPGSVSVQYLTQPNDLHPEKTEEWKTSSDESPEPFIRFTGTEKSCAIIRLIIGDLPRSIENPDTVEFALGEVIALRDGQNVALHCKVKVESIREMISWRASYLTDGFVYWGMLTRPSGPNPRGYRSEGLLPKTPLNQQHQWVDIDLGDPRSFQEIRMIPAQAFSYSGAESQGFPLRFQLLGKKQPDEEWQVLYSHTQKDFPNPGKAHVCIPVAAKDIRYLRLDVPALREYLYQKFFALGELEVYSGNENIAKKASVIAWSFSDKGLPWLPEGLTDGRVENGTLLNWEEWTGDIEQRKALIRERTGLSNRRFVLIDRFWRQTFIMIGFLTGFLLAGFFALFVHFRHETAKKQEQLRFHLANDLHDEVGSNLSAILMLCRQPAADTQPDSFSEIRHIAQHTLYAMRDIVRLIRQKHNNWPDFMHTFRESLEIILQTVPHTIQEYGKCPAGNLDIAKANDILLFSKEACHNAIEHSRAERIAVEIHWKKNSEFILCIADNGIGFDEDDPEFVPGAGLANLRTRAKNMKAELSIDSRKGKGTTITLKGRK